MSLHVVPLNDERDHVLATDCWCEPRVDWIDPETGSPWASGDAMVVHSAADCREMAEEVTGDSIEESKEWKVVEA